MGPESSFIRICLSKRAVKPLAFMHGDIRRVPFVGLGHRGPVAIDQTFYLCDTRTIHEISRAGISDEETIDARFTRDAGRVEPDEEL